MSTDSPRALAARVLVAVWRDGQTLEAALQASAVSRLAARDAALTRALCYETLRFQPRLEFWLRHLLSRPLKASDLGVQAVLALGLCQLTEMRIPAHAALSESADACRELDKTWAVPLVNGVLRSFQRQRSALQSRLAESPAALFAHPDWLVRQLRADWPDEWRDILTANNAHPPLTLRVNRQRSSPAVLREELATCGVQARTCEFSPDGLAVDVPTDVTALPAFAAGKFSVQDEAAQLAARLLDAAPGLRVLDACAAPGGKTCHILESTPGVGLLALDSSAARAARVHENLARLGLEAAIQVADAAEPASWWDGRPFDRILLDVPCSATGIIRRHPDIKYRRHPADVTAAVATQARLLAALWPLVARGGKLLYATCSVLTEENEAQMQRFLHMTADARAIDLPGSWGAASGAGRRIATGQAGMDGFYYAGLVKTGVGPGA